MSRRPMSAGEFASLSRVTPTALAEQAYEAKLRQNKPMPIGRAGIPVPPPNTIYAKQRDAKILHDHAKRAVYREYDRHLAAGGEPIHPRAKFAVLGARVGWIGGWPGIFKVRTGRWPRWLEIEREWPLLGEWMAEQRKSI